MHVQFSFSISGCRVCVIYENEIATQTIDIALFEKSKFNNPFEIYGLRFRCHDNAVCCVALWGLKS